ncbi:MAG: hypothetical protein IJA36_07670, partial [Lachnospiraceae bacterium]|nr:hypothetical protein [Lachnospiraceae bacterium]
ENLNFCTVKGELVECIPGRVQDCMTKQLSRCPLEEEVKAEKEKAKEKKQKKKENLNFCTVKGELVQCIPGRVQDCMTKQLSKCPLEEKVKAEKEKAKEKKQKKKENLNFCTVKGELVECIPGRVQDCMTKQLSRCPLEEEVKVEKEKTKEKKKENLNFCTVKGELVECIPGRVQDCMTKQLSKCPLEEGM